MVSLMKHNIYAEEQTISILKGHGGGMKADDVASKLGQVKNRRISNHFQKGYLKVPSLRIRVIG